METLTKKIPKNIFYSSIFFTHVLFYKKIEDDEVNI
jgi:hypothetical protein